VSELLAQYSRCRLTSENGSVLLRPTQNESLPHLADYDAVRLITRCRQQSPDRFVGRLVGNHERLVVDRHKVVGSDLPEYLPRPLWRGVGADKPDCENCN